jgi:branched-chain amino acid transport system ATP-binding protein
MDAPSLPPVLVADHLAKAFGGVHAVRDVSFDVRAGELVALIGPNGAGKTTCFNLINGQLAPDRGEVRLGTQRIDGLPPATIARKGVGRTFQVAATFASMTVRENVELALIAHAGDAGAFIDRGAAERSDAAEALLARVGVADLATAHCATLTYGDAKRVELALALAASPRLMLMDEPTAGMAIASRADLMRLAATLAHRDGLALLFTEHDMDMVFGFADRVIVLDRGAIIATGSPAEIRADPRVQAVYLGQDDAA